MKDSNDFQYINISRQASCHVSNIVNWPVWQVPQQRHPGQDLSAFQDSPGFPLLTLVEHPLHSIEQTQSAELEHRLTRQGYLIILQSINCHLSSPFISLWMDTTPIKNFSVVRCTKNTALYQRLVWKKPHALPIRKYWGVDLDECSTVEENLGAHLTCCDQLWSVL